MSQRHRKLVAGRSGYPGDERTCICPVASKLLLAEPHTAESAITIQLSDEVASYQGNTTELERASIKSQSNQSLSN